MAGGRRFLDVRCPRCNRLLYRIEQDALRANKAVEVKCGACNAMTYRIGDPVRDEREPRPDARR